MNDDRRPTEFAALDMRRRSAGSATAAMAAMVVPDDMPIPRVQMCRHVLMAADAFTHPMRDDDRSVRLASRRFADFQGIYFLAWRRLALRCSGTRSSKPRATRRTSGVSVGM